VERATLVRIASYLKPYKGQILVIAALLVISALLNLVPPLLIKRMIDHALPERDLTQLLWLAFAMIAAPGSAGLLDVGEKYLTTLLGERVMFDLRTSLFRHLQKQPMDYFTAAKPGAALSSVLNDVQGVGGVMSGTLMDIAQSCIVFIATASMLFAMDWRIALAACLFLPFFAFPARRAGRARKNVRRQTQEKMAEFVGLLSETLSVSGALLLKVFGTEEAEARRVEDKAREVMNLSLRQALIGRWFRLMMSVLESCGPALIWGLGGYLYLRGGVELGTLVASAALLQKMNSPATKLAGVYVDLVTSYAYFDRIFAVLDREPSIKDRPGARDIEKARGDLWFRNVSFSYRPDEPVLEDIDVAVASGERLALVGASGAGKSTIAALIARLYDPTEGAILLDGVDLRDITLKSLRAQIGVVSQDTFLFHTSIFENLRYGRPEATHDEVVAAARAAQIYSLIERLPDGFETQVGDRGYRLSGGERQRVAIARAILRDPRILILDEATSALDSFNEALVQQALDTLMKGRTSIVIAHRLSTVRNADIIAVLDSGRIVERGRHEELLARNGLYVKLCREQVILSDVAGAEGAAAGSRTTSDR
jgi:ATP-binding cassette subfamily B protein